MLGIALKTAGVNYLVSKLSALFKNNKNEALNQAGIILEDVSKAFEKGDVSKTDQAELNRHLEEMTRLDIEKEQAIINDVNKTIQAELSINDPFVRRMRPTFGYIMAVTWFAQMSGVAYVIFFDPQNAPAILSALGALSPIWGVGLSVLGIYVYKRSEDKKNLGQKH